MKIKHPAEAMLRAAAQLQHAGRTAESISAYEQILARWPDLADAWYNLAYQLRLVGRFEHALAAYRNALDRGISRPEEIRLNRSVIYSEDLRDDAAAGKELDAALKLRPGFVPALFNLASLRENRGKRDEARALYAAVLDHDPSHSEALARYAGTQAAWEADSPLIDRLAAAMDRPHGTPAEKASLGFALGGALDRIAHYDRAFAVYERANRESRKSAPPSPYDRTAHEAFVNQIIRAFPSDGRRHPRPSVRPPPIFICGMFRSGSTLVEQILAAHRRVTAGGELELLPKLAQSAFAPFPSSMERVTEAQLERHATAYLQRLHTLFPNADVLTDKRPENFLYIGLIKALFPDALIVNTVRHPLDNCLSIYFLHLSHSMGYALDLMDTAHHYREYRRLMAHWKSLYGSAIFDFDYDAYVREPEVWTRKLLDFCGLDWNETCLAFHQNDNEVRTASAWQVREPLYSRASGRWRNYERQLLPVREYLADLLPDNQDR